eukprot:2354233-Rhodomonas_salina.3
MQCPVHKALPAIHRPTLTWPSVSYQLCTMWYTTSYGMSGTDTATALLPAMQSPVLTCPSIYYQECAAIRSQTPLLQVIAVVPSAYAHPTRCPVLTSRTVLPAQARCLVLTYHTVLLASYAMSGTDMPYHSPASYAMRGTDTQYHAARATLSFAPPPS